VADEIVPSTIGDLIAGEVMAAEFLMLLAASEDNVLMHPALMRATASSRSSTVVRVPHLGLAGTNILSSTTPGSEVANTALTVGSTDVTIAMRALRYTRDDLAGYIADGKLDAPMFARAAVISIAQTLIDLIANVTDDFTSTTGTSGVNATWNDIIDAKTTLGVANASGRMLGLLHPQQWGDLESDMLSAGVSLASVAAGSLNAGLGSFKGSWLDIDFFTSTRVPLANTSADRAGAIFTRGGVAWADAQMDDEGDPNLANLGRGCFERERQGTYLATSYIMSHAAGVSKALDGAGVSVITDA